MRKTAPLLVLALAAGLLAGCDSDADKANDNLDKLAEQFKVQRRIVIINTQTDKILASFEGKCSLEFPTGKIDVTCKTGPGKAEATVIRNSVGVTRNVTYISTQLEPVPVNFYRTKIVLKPTSIVPDFDLLTGS
jgi:hypothetical protein